MNHMSWCIVTYILEVKWIRDNLKWMWEALMKNLHEFESSWWSDDDGLGIVCTQSNCQCGLTFQKIDQHSANSRAVRRKWSTYTCIVWEQTTYVVGLYASGVVR